MTELPIALDIFTSIELRNAPAESITSVLGWLTRASLGMLSVGRLLTLAVTRAGVSAQREMDGLDLCHTASRRASRVASSTGERRRALRLITIHQDGPGFRSVSWKAANGSGPGEPKLNPRSC